MTVTADRNGNVKGYPVVSRVTVPVRIDGHLNVGDAVWKGTLTVIRNMGLKDPYVGTIELQTGEIAEGSLHRRDEHQELQGLRSMFRKLRLLSPKG